MTIRYPDYFVQDEDIRRGFAEDVSGETMIPEFVVRPTSVEEISDCLRFCNEHSIAVTPAGAQTNDTASSLAERGVSLWLGRMKRILEVNPEQGYAVVEPGVLLGDLKRELVEQDLFYAPDPSSENIASLGGTVATNAAGARSYKYGSTARHILGLEVVLADGSIEEISCTDTTKTTTGPAAFNQMSAAFVGSEGILGVISKIRIRLIRGVPQAFAIVAFFPDVFGAIQFALDCRLGTYPAIGPRSMEYLDNSCLKLLRDSGKYPQVPQLGGAAIICEQEYRDGELEDFLDAWIESLAAAGALVDDSIVAETDQKIRELRELRHYIPATLNEHGSAARPAGGRKVSTDWAVPLARFAEMTIAAERLSQDFGFSSDRVYRYAHLGDGHPHYNLIPQTHEELKRCLELREEYSKLAVSFGGTVAAEHGIGKLRRSLLEYENPALKLRMLRALKQELDPKGILSPGNILP